MTCAPPQFTGPDSKRKGEQIKQIVKSESYELYRYELDTLQKTDSLSEHGSGRRQE